MGETGLEKWRVFKGSLWNAGSRVGQKPQANRIVNGDRCNKVATFYIKSNVKWKIIFNVKGILEMVAFITIKDRKYHLI